jgi:hypothetical protein
MSKRSDKAKFDAKHNCGIEQPWNAAAAGQELIFCGMSRWPHEVLTVQAGRLILAPGSAVG